MDISIYNFKNYYNRSGKGFAELSSYASMLLENYENIQFNPNDGVSTNLILDMSEGLDPDYLIVSNAGAIVSRWYVMECKRTRLSQYRLTLKRDVIVDYKDVIASSSAFIERGYLPDTDPGIYNSEPVAMNQIKKQEIPLPDKTNCNWIVGYFSSANTIDGESLIENVSGDYAFSGCTTIPTRANWQYLPLTLGDGGAVQKINGWNLIVRVENLDYYQEFEHVDYSPLISAYGDEKQWDSTTTRFKAYSEDMIWIGKQLNSKFRNIPGGIITIQNWLKAALNVEENINYTDLLSENGKVYYVSSENKYYQVNIVVSKNMSIESRLRYDALYNTDAYNNAVALVNQISEITDYPAQKGGIEYTGTYTFYKVSFDEITEGTLHTKISSNRRRLIDAPYCMFCIPYIKKVKQDDGSYVESGAYIQDGDNLIQSNPSEMLNIAQKIAEQYSGAGWLYDIQILPYYPGSETFILQNGNINVSSSSASEDIDFNWIFGPTNKHIGVIIWCSYSRKRFNIETTLTMDGGPKISNCCDVYRLVAPNYNSSYEFSVAKNNNVPGFEVEFEYKPHNPYIHINPIFQNLYGQDFDDARGLICSGDYSLAIVSNAWTTYQLQNVNFQKIFDRQIENMDVNHTYDLIGHIAGAIGGVSSGALNGVMAGTAGGPAGMVAGGIAGGVMGVVGGVADIALGEARYAEQKDFSKDMFAYNLQNVKALPNTLAKVSALTPTNKQFPFIEIYKPTELERQLFMEYIELKGMNVGRVDIIGNYIIADKYLKAQIIRMPAIKGDTHISQAIATEIDKGVYW